MFTLSGYSVMVSTILCCSLKNKTLSGSPVPEISVETALIERIHDLTFNEEFPCNDA